MCRGVTRKRRETARKVVQGVAKAGSWEQTGADSSDQLAIVGGGGGRWRRPAVGPHTHSLSLLEHGGGADGVDGPPPAAGGGRRHVLRTLTSRALHVSPRTPCTLFHPLHLLPPPLPPKATFLASGVFFGFQPLQRVLLARGLFASHCPHPRNTTTASPPTTTTSSTSTPTTALCDAQADLLDLLYTVTIATLYFSMALFGPLMDRLGARAVLGLGLVLAAVGTALLACAGHADVPAAAGFALLGLCSPAVFSPAMALPRLFALQSGVVTTLVVCLFDASALVPYLWYLLFEHGGLSWLAICLGHAGLLAVVGCIAIPLMPRQSDVAAIDAAYEREVTNKVTGINVDDGDVQPVNAHQQTRHHPAELGADGERQPLLSAADGDKGSGVNAKDGNVVAAPDAGAGLVGEVVRQPAYILVILFVAVVGLKNGFYIATLQQQIERLDPGNTHVFTIFSLVFPMGGFISIPISVAMLQGLRGRFDLNFGLVLAIALLHAALNLIPALGAQYAAVAVFAVVRSLKWSTFAEFLVESYPLAVMGRLMGIGNVVLGLFCLAVFGFFRSARAFDGAYTFPNATLTAVEGLCLALPFYLHWSARRRR